MSGLDLARRVFRRLGWMAVCTTAVLVAEPGRAQWSGARMQAQLSIGSGVSAAPFGFGLVGASGAVSIRGVGAVAELGYERVTADAARAARRGSYGSLGVEFRPLCLLDSNVYRRLDPHVVVGGRFGQVTQARASGDRSVLSIGVGIDVGLNDYGDSQWILTLRYRLEPGPPAVGPDHAALLGFGFRFLDGREVDGSPGWH